MKKLVAYITTSYPSKEFTVDLALSLKENGVDSLELGVPFSDPVADGPVIEKANLLALKNGFKLDDLFYVTEKISKEIDTLYMGYMNPFYHYGFDEFLKKSSSLGVSGTIIPDMPFEMAQKYNQSFEKYNISNITFVAPTTPKDRVNACRKFSKVYIYGCLCWNYWKWKR